MANRYLIIVTGFNCADYVRACYESLAKQTYTNWRAVFISDGSTDNTAMECLSITDERVMTEKYNDNMGAAFRRFNALRKYGADEDIFLLLGMDDCLQPEALETIDKEYQKGVWMTYGNYSLHVQKRNKPKRYVPMTRESLQFDDATHNNRDYRKVKYRSTAPNTFRKFLFNRLTPDDFQVDGKWIKATTESPLMFACLEMCGRDKIGVITEPIYFYRQRNDNARNRFGSEYQDNIYRDIISRPKKDLLYYEESMDCRTSP
jgi:glycosyltransferase involved in cell wall biosynthesis